MAPGPNSNLERQATIKPGWEPLSVALRSRVFKYMLKEQERLLSKQTMLPRIDIPLEASTITVQVLHFGQVCVQRTQQSMYSFTLPQAFSHSLQRRGNLSTAQGDS